MTNNNQIIYFSSLIYELKKYSKYWIELKAILDENKIQYKFIQNTKDIWCRDYMPVKRCDGKFVQFRFQPDYYNSPKHISRMTIQNDIELENFPQTTKSELIVDGGNVICCNSTAILTEKVLKENPKYTRNEIIEILKNDLAADKVHLTPILPYDISGHIDGMLKILNENTLLVADYSYQSPTWQKKMNMVLLNTGFNLIPFPDAPQVTKNNDGDYTALGCYINFIVTDKIVLLPQFNLTPYDQQAITLTRTLYPNYKVIPVNCIDIAIDGGVLNCITWNY